MKLFTLRPWTILCLLLMAAPVWAQPTWQWASQGTTTGGLEGAKVVAAVADAAGNTVVAGYFDGTLTLGTTTLTASGQVDLFVARLSPTGQWLQAVRAGGVGRTEPKSLLVDAAGTVTVAGNLGYGNAAGSRTGFGPLVLTSAGPNNLFVARLSPAGTWVQALLLGGPDYVFAGPLALDAAGNAVVVGLFAKTLTIGTTTLTSGRGHDVFVARLNPAGQWGQVVQAGGPNANSSISPVAAAFDAAGNLVVAGSFLNTFRFGPTTPITSTGTSEDIFVARLNPAGQWVQAVRAGAASDDQVLAIAADAVGSVFIAGNVGGTATGSAVSFGSIILPNIMQSDAFVAKLNAAGVWTQAVAGGGPNYDSAQALAVDGAGNAVVAGSFGLDFSPVSSGGTATFGSATLTSAGGQDGFLGRLNAAGQWTQVQAVGGPGDNYVNALTLNSSGAATVAGSFVGMLPVGSFTLSNSGSLYAPFIARLNGFALATHAAAPAAVFTLAPNPATAQVRLAWPEASATPRPVLVLDGLGREVRRQQLPAHATTAVLDVQGLPPGLYLVRCGPATGQLVVE